MNKKISICFTLLPLIISAVSCAANKEVVEGGIANETTFAISGEKTIDHSGIPSTICVFDYIPISSCYGIFDGKRYNVTAEITAPDGTTSTSKRDFYVEQEGNYTVTLSCKMGGTLVSETVNVVASGYNSKSLCSFSNATYYGDGVPVSQNVYNSFAPTGFKARLNPENSSIKYRNIVNLNEVEGNLVEFCGNPDRDYLELKNVRVTLTDVYDSSLYVTVEFKINDAAALGGNYLQHGSINNFMQVGYRGICFGDNSEYSALNNYTVAWDQSLWTTFSSKAGNYVPCSFIYNVNDNTIRTCTRFSNWGNENKYTLIRDLDDPDDSYADFPGWTTGEVYISFDGNGTAGDIVVTKIGNQIFDNVSVEDYSKNTGELITKGYDFENMPDGAINYYYPLPNVSYSTGDISAHMYFNEGENWQEVQVDNFSSFYPTKAGNYRVTYASKNAFGKNLSFEGTFSVKEKPYALVDNSNPNLNAVLFEKTTVPNFSYSGGNGILTKEIHLVTDSSDRILNEGDAFTLQEKSKVNKFIVIVTDSIRNTRSYEYNLNVNNNVVRFRLVDSYDCVSVVAGDTFTVPNYIAIDYSKDDVSRTNIPVVIRRGKTQTYQPGDLVQITADTNFTYSYGTNLLGTVSVRCVPDEISLEDPEKGPDKQFNNTSSIGKKELSYAGLNFYLEGQNASISQPYPVSTTSLTISFSVFTKYCSFNEVKAELLSMDGESLELTFTDVGTEKSEILINNKSYGIRAETDKTTYTGTDIPSLYGSQYITYTAVVDGGKEAIFNSSNIQIGEITNWSSGNPFTGFENACAFVRFNISGASNGDIFSLTKVSNQLMTKIGLSYGDLAAPAIAFTDNTSSAVVSYGDSRLIHRAYAYDVFSGQASVRMSVIGTDGEYYSKNISAQDYVLSFTEYGSYIVAYSFRDTHSNNDTVRYVFAVNDEEAPVIRVSGTYKESYSGKVKILPATVSDNTDNNPTLTISIRSDSAERTLVEAGKTYKLQKGKYQIIYYAFDETGNSSRIAFDITIK